MAGSVLHLSAATKQSLTDMNEVPSTAPLLVTTLCVQGLPENMLNNPDYLSKALEWYFRQSTGFEVSNCTINHGVGFLTFTDALGE